MAIAAEKIQKHAVLASLVVAGITFVVVALAGTAVSKALLARVINVQPGANGLGHVSSELPSDEQTLGDTVTQAGQDTSRSMIFQAAAKSD